MSNPTIKKANDIIPCAAGQWYKVYAVTGGNEVEITDVATGIALDVSGGNVLAISDAGFIPNVDCYVIPFKGAPGAGASGGVNANEVQAMIAMGWGAATVHDYGLLNAPLDLSDFEVTANERTAATDEIWLEFGDTVYTVTWPTGWIWVDTLDPPAFSGNTAYCITVRRERENRICVCLAYMYRTTDSDS